MEVLEREPQSGALSDYADEARAGHGRLVLVAGAAGSGKTTLVQELRRRTPHLRWAWGVCAGPPTPGPLGPLLAAADQLGGPLLAACQDGARRDRLFALLREALREEPTALVVEDVERADASTLDLVRYLGRVIGETPAMLVLTCGDDEPLRPLLEELVGRRWTRRVDVGPLSPAAVGRLARGTGHDAAEVHRWTGGNAFFVTEVARNGRHPLPALPQDILLGRLDRASPTAVRVAEAAAMAGAAVGPELLQAAAGASADHLQELVDAAILARDGDGVRFRHELGRLAVERRLPVDRRRDLHVRLLAAMIAHEVADEACLAHQAEAAGEPAAVLRFAPLAAGRAAELGAHREAAAQLERALRFAGGRAPGERAGLYAALATELTMLDRWADAAAAWETAGGLYREVGNARSEGDALSRLARARWWTSRPQEAHRLSRAALDLLEPAGETEELSRAVALHAALELERGEPDEALRLADEAEALAGRLGVLDVLADSLTDRAAVLMVSGDARWESFLQRARRVAVTAGLDEQIARVHATLLDGRIEEHRYADAERAFADGAAFCEEHDVPTYGARLLGSRARMLTELDRWEEAAAVAGQLLARPALPPSSRFAPLVALGLALVRQGDRTGEGPLEEAVQEAAATGEAARLALVLPARAEAHWLAGEHPAAAALLRERPPLGPSVRGTLAGRLAVWSRRLGLPADDVDPDRLPAPFRLAVAGDHAAAARAWEELGCDYEAALALLDGGSDEDLGSAAERLEAMGATPAAELARRVANQRPGVVPAEG